MVATFSPTKSSHERFLKRHPLSLTSWLISRYMLYTTSLQLCR